MLGTAYQLTVTDIAASLANLAPEELFYQDLEIDLTIGIPTNTPVPKSLLPTRTLLI